MASSLPRRIAVAAIAIPAAVGMVYLGGWVLVVGLAMLGIVGTGELFKLADKGGVKAFPALGYAGAVLMPVATFLALEAGGGLDPFWMVAAATVWVLATMAYALSAADVGGQPVVSMAVTIFGPIYTAGLPAFLLLVRHGVTDRSPGVGTLLVLLPLVTTWLCDTFAMVGGAAFGGPKFAPTVSPKKTWSGALSGLLGAGAVALMYGWLVLREVGIALTAWQLLIIGLVVGVLGQIGDLAESLLKRSAGVKDSGTFFPGHGGVLDRLDSLYWVIPLSAMCFYAFGVL
jgi:phosphatidate cytidylyltransferase